MPSDVYSTHVIVFIDWLYQEILPKDSNDIKNELQSFILLYDFLVTVKAAPHECVIRTGQTQTYLKAENEAWFYSKVTVSSCAITSV